MERTEGTVPIYQLVLTGTQMGLGVIDDRIEIRNGLDVVVGGHGGIIRITGRCVKMDLDRVSYVSPIGYGVHFQRMDCVQFLAGRETGPWNDRTICEWHRVGAIKYKRRISPLSHITGPATGYQYGPTGDSTTMAPLTQTNKKGK
jgi:hypothetical protein